MGDEKLISTTITQNKAKVRFEDGKSITFNSIPSGRFEMGWPRSPELFVGGEWPLVFLYGGLGALLFLLVLGLIRLIQKRRVQYSLAGILTFVILVGVICGGVAGRRTDLDAMSRSQLLISRYTEFNLEMPAHEVEITRPFYMGIYEITNGQYASVMKEKVVLSEIDLPRDYVTWDEAMEFCKILTEMVAKNRSILSCQRPWKTAVFRLPTEAEWEYACRAGTTTAFHCGDFIGMDDANFRADEVPEEEKYKSYMRGSGELEIENTVNVGQYPSNAFGLYDMHGNLSEWCRDGWHVYTGSKKIDPAQNLWHSDRIVKGGSYNHYAFDLRSAARDASDKKYCDGFIGFRIVLFLKN